jgi:hypothetical protein
MRSGTFASSSAYLAAGTAATALQTWFFAHVGGFVFGVATVRLFAKHRPPRPVYEPPPTMAHPTTPDLDLRG